MNKLQITLESFKGRLAAGLKGGTETISPVSKEEFKERVKVISGNNRVFLWINIVMLIIVFLGSIFLVYHFLDDLNKLAVIFSISGVSIAGMIYYMTYLWRQIVGIDMAIAMVDKLDPSALPAIINSLLASLSKKEG